jgi:hypothetical protein
MKENNIHKRPTEKDSSKKDIHKEREINKENIYLKR